MVMNEHYSTNIKYPWMMYSYVKDSQDWCTVDFYVHTMSKKKFTVNVSECGTKLYLNAVVAKQLYSPARFMKTNSHKSNFNQNAHRTTSFEGATLEAVESMGESKNLRGEPMVVALPFPCNPSRKKIEIKLNVYKNPDEEIASGLATAGEGGSDPIPNYQRYLVLTVNLINKENKRILPRNNGGFRVC